jgi:hypothetical protein
MKCIVPFHMIPSLIHPRSCLIHFLSHPPFNIKPASFALRPFMASWSNSLLTQAVRDCLSGEVAHIPTTIDHETGQCVVLWKNIQDAFENAQSVRSGKQPVPFMKDEYTQK